MAESDNDCKVYVGSLKFETTNDGLYSHFMQAGQVTKAEVILDRETGRSRGFGFVTFEESTSVSEALKLNDTELDGRHIKVSKANSRSSGGGSSESQFRSRGGRGGGGYGGGSYGGGRRGGYSGGGFGGGNYHGSYGGNYSSSGQFNNSYGGGAGHY